MAYGVQAEAAHDYQHGWRRWVYSGYASCARALAAS